MWIAALVALGAVVGLSKLGELAFQRARHKGWTTYTEDDGLAGNHVRSIAVAPDGALWFSTEDGVSRFDGQAWTTYTEEDEGLADNRVRSIAVAPDGALWFSTEDGVSRFDGQTWTTYTTRDGLARNDVTSIAVAPDGALWFGVWRGGVSRFDGQTWTTYTEDDGLTSHDVISIAVAPDGALWFGTGSAVSRFDGQAWTTYTTRDGLADNWVRSIAVAPDGALWFSTEDGVSRFDGQTWTTYTKDDGLAGNDVWPIAVAPDGALWFGTYGGVSRFDGQTWTTYTPANSGLARGRVSALAVDGQGRMWVGTRNGLSVVDMRVGLPSVQVLQAWIILRVVLYDVTVMVLLAIISLAIVWIVRRSQNLPSLCSLQAKMRSLMRVERTRVGWNTWLWWILANSMGWVVGGFVVAVVVAVVDWVWPSDDGMALLAIILLGPFALGLAGLFGAVVGTMQWLVVRRRVTRAGRWVLASSVGWAVGLYAGEAVGLDVFGYILGWGRVEPLSGVWAVILGVVGAAVGIMQWLVVRRRVTRAGWWVLASALGWAVAGPVVGPVFSAVDEGVVGAMVGAVVVAGAVVGVITGAALVLLVAQDNMKGRDRLVLLGICVAVVSVVGLLTRPTFRATTSATTTTAPRPAQVDHAAWSPDGTRIVTICSPGPPYSKEGIFIGSSDPVPPRVWDATSGEELAVLGHTYDVRHVAWSPDGTRIVTARGDAARVWDAASGKELAVLTGHTDVVDHAAWSPDGTRIVTASWDETARVWDAASGEELAVLAGHTASVGPAAWSPDGTRVVTASGDETARVWDTVSGEELAVLAGHTDYVRHAVWSPDGTRVVTLSSMSDRTVRVWDAETGAELLTLGHRDWIRQVEWNADGTRIFGSGQMAQVWDATSGEELALLIDGYRPQYKTQSPVGTPVVHIFLPAHVVWSPDGTRVVTAVCDASDNYGCLASTARVWDATSGEELAVLTGHTDDVQHVAWSPDGTRIVTASEDGTARVWDAASGEELVVLAAGSHR